MDSKQAVKRNHDHNFSGPVWKYLLVLFALCMGLWGWTAGLWDLWGIDESRYVQISEELLHRDNWFLLTLHDNPYDQKPPLPFWLMAAMLKLSGGEVVSGLLRLPSVLLGTASTLLTFLIGRRFWNGRAGLLSALILMTSGQFAGDVPSAELNIMFTGWTLIAISVWLLAPEKEKLSFIRAACFWLALSAAFLTKGPLCLLVVLSALIGQAWQTRSAGGFLRVRPFWGLLFLASIVGGWLYMQGRAAGVDFVATQVKGETLERFLHGSHSEPFWFYFPRLFTSIFVPWALLLVPAALKIWSLRRKELPTGMGTLLGWILIPFFLFTLANGKRESYLLPLLPAMALIVGWYIDRLQTDGIRLPRLGFVMPGLLTVSASVLPIAAFLLWLQPSLLDNAEYSWNVDYSILLCFFAAGAGLLGFLVMKRHKQPVVNAMAVVGFIYLLQLMIFTVFYPAQNLDESGRVFSDTLDNLTARMGEDHVGAIDQGTDPEYHVYGEYDILHSNEDFNLYEGLNIPEILVTDGETWAEIQSISSLSDYVIIWQGEVADDLMVICADRKQMEY